MSDRPTPEATPPRYVCETCGQESPIACCTNKQCSRHGRGNDYLKGRMPPHDLSADNLARLHGEANEALLDTLVPLMMRATPVLNVARALVVKYGYGARAGRSDYLVSIPADEFDELTKAVEGYRDA
jgi:hypothetical protein